MPGYRTHILAYSALIVSAVALTSYLGIASLPSTPTLLAGIAVGGLYSLLPDVDIPSSRIREAVSVAALAVIMLSMAAVASGRSGLGILYPALALSLFLYLLWFSRHRGPYHTPAAAVLFCAPLWYLDPFLAECALIGYVSHLVLDGEVFR